MYLVRSGHSLTYLLIPYGRLARRTCGGPRRLRPDCYRPCYRPCLSRRSNSAHPFFFKPLNVHLFFSDRVLRRVRHFTCLHSCTKSRAGTSLMGSDSEHLYRTQVRHMCWSVIAELRDLNERLVSIRARCDQRNIF